MTKQTRIGLLLLSFLCAVVSVSFGDGVKIPLQAYKKLPAIPQQRAVIVYKDGVEKLIIESSLDGEGKEFAWIVPVPSEPTAFEQAPRTILDALSQGTRTEVIDSDRKGRVPISIGVGFFVLIWGLAMIRYDHHPLRVTAAVTLISLPIVFVVVPLVPLSRSRSDGYKQMAEESVQPGIKIEQSTVVGNYELTVLQAADADALQTWLTDNGYMALPGKGDAIVDDYIDNDWHFVAAKLRRDKEGFSRPHPIVMTFPASSPVYPMRLTQLPGSDLYLELFVIADGRAVAEHLSPEHVDTYQSQVTARNMVYIGGKWEVRLELPDLKQLMWDECTVTKLSGELTPATMDQDVHVQLSKAKPYRERLYSKRGARVVALTCGALAWGILVPFLLYGFLVSRNSAFANSNRRVAAFIAYGLLGPIVVAAALGIVIASLFVVFLLASTVGNLATSLIVYLLAWAACVYAVHGAYRRLITDPREKRERKRLTRAILLPVLAFSLLLAAGVYLALPKTETYLAPRSSQVRKAAPASPFTIPRAERAFDDETIQSTEAPIE